MKEALVALAIAAAAVPAFAQQNSGQHGTEPKGGEQSASALSEGEIRKVDENAQKITIRHGPLTNLGMPAMTMVFHVKDPTMLSRVKAGDKVRFRAEKVNGALTVTEIEPAQ